MQKSIRRYGRMAAVVLAAAAVAGVIDGLVARLLMRGIALIIGHRPEFTVPGTLIIAVAFAAFAVPAAATATARPVIRRTARWITALAMGWVTALTGLGDAQGILLAEDSQRPLITALLVGFGVMVVAHGHIAQWTVRRLTRPAEAPEPTQRRPAAAS